MYYTYAYHVGGTNGPRICLDFKTLAAAIEWITGPRPAHIAYTAIVFVPFD